jgi:putative transposase
MLDPARLVFIDETAVSTNMVRLRGRAPRGVRVIGAVPLGRWETITFVAALRHNKMVAPMVIEGAMTGEMFLAYVENCLVPMLRRNDIVMMDNCRVHLGPAFAGLSKKRARHCVTCRNIRPTSIPSRCLTANSRHSCVK